MTLKSAIRQMRQDEAAKRPSMCGYVFKDTEGFTEEEVDAGMFRLVFVGKDGSRSSFPMGGASDTDEKSSVTADSFFVENLIEDNWEVALKDDLEAARSGQGNW